MDVGEDTTAAPGPAQPQHEADVMDVGGDTTATPWPAQPLPPILDEEEAEDVVLSREMTNDRELFQLSQEMVLKKPEKGLRRETKPDIFTSTAFQC